MKTQSKDNGYYSKPVNYSNVFANVDANSLSLINSCKATYKDKSGVYVYTAVSFDKAGNVYFEKQYIK